MTGNAYSHHHEVTLRLLIKPGMPVDINERATKILINTHKSFHTSRHNSKNESLLLGLPQTISRYTVKGQFQGLLVHRGDKCFRVNETAVREERTDIRALEGVWT